MKILVSDYDGTYNPYYLRKPFEKNRNAVDDFRKNGNLFIIATARSPKHMYEEIKKWDIKYDYLICNNGSIVIDSNGNIIFTTIFYEEYDSYLIEIISYLYSLTNYQSIDQEGKSPTKASYQVRILTLELTDDKSIFHKFGSKANVLLDKIRTYQNSNKRDGLIELLKTIKVSLNYSEIYSIGNSINDIELLKRFNGFKVPWSNPYLLLRTDIPTISSVHSLTKKIQQEK